MINGVKSSGARLFRVALFCDFFFVFLPRKNVYLSVHVYVYEFVMPTSIHFSPPDFSELEQMYKTESSPSLFSPPIIIPFLVELFDSKLRDSKHDFSPEKKSSLRREKTGRKIYIYIYIKWTREGKGGRDERIIWRAHGPDGSMAAFEMGGG